MTIRRVSVPLLFVALVAHVGCSKKNDVPAPKQEPTPTPSQSGPVGSAGAPLTATDADKVQFEALKQKGAKVEVADFGRGPGYEVTFERVATDEDLKSVNGLKCVTYLRIHTGHNITNAGIKALKDLDSLTLLIINDCKSLTAEGLENINRFPNLTFLSLSGNAIEDAALVEVAKLKHLKDLTLAYNRKITDTGMAHVGKLTTLQKLDMQDCTVTDEGLKSLKGLNGLTQLSLARTKITDAGFDMLDCPKLEELGLTGTAITDAGLAKLAKFPKLERLFIPGTKVTKTGVAAFQKAMPKTTVIGD